MRSGFTGIIGKEMFRVLVSSVRRLGALAQIDESAGIGQHAMVTLRAEPGHGERHRSAGTAAVGHAAFRIFGQLNAGFFLDARQNFGFHEIGEDRRHRIIFKAALWAAVGDHHRHHHRQTAISNHVVEDVRELAVSAGRRNPREKMNGAGLPGTY